MRIYIATALERAEEAKALSLKLKEAGHKMTYEWWVHGSVQELGPERIKEVADHEANGVIGADVVIALLPGGRGTHAELGIAIASSWFQHYLKRREMTERRSPQIILVGEQNQAGRECAFYYHPAVTRVVTIDDALERLNS